MTDPRRVDTYGRLALVVLVAAFGLLAARELVRPVLTARRELRSLHEAVRILGEAEGDIDQLNAEIRRVAGQVAEIETLLPGEPNLDAFLELLGVLAQRHRIHVERVTPHDLSAHAQYRAQAVDLRAAGSFLALYRFLRDLEKGPQLVRIDQMHVVRAEESSACVLELSLSLYYAPTGGSSS
jgi:Tfp pilus assembly protein PilO